MARDDERDRVGAARIGDSAEGCRVTDVFSHLRVCPCFASWYPLKARPDSTLKVSPTQVEAERKLGGTSSSKLCERTCHLLEISTGISRETNTRGIEGELVSQFVDRPADQHRCNADLGQGSEYHPDLRVDRRPPE